MKNRNAKNGWVIWITGLPGSGKSTIAKNLLKRLLSLRITVELLSTDELRRIITPVLKYTEEEREVLYGFVAYTAERLTKNGINIIIDGTGNRRKYRDFCRNKINKFIEVYLKCPLEICMKRERLRKNSFYAPKEIYQKALKNQSNTIPGIGVSYEEPIKPDLLLNSAKLTAKECVDKIFDYIKKKL